MVAHAARIERASKHERAHIHELMMLVIDDDITMMVLVMMMMMMW